MWCIFGLSSEHVHACIASQRSLIQLTFYSSSRTKSNLASVNSKLVTIVLQRSWWKGTAKTLQLSVPIDWREAIGVTPQILATDISVKLGEYIQVGLPGRQKAAFPILPAHDISLPQCQEGSVCNA